MPGWESALGGPQGVTEVAVYLQSLRGERVDAGLARAGELKFAGICVSCHGVDGKGNQALGAPNLTDDYWLYGDSIAAIKQSIAQGRNGAMPAHAPIIGETRVRLVGAYVWSLSHTPNDMAQAETRDGDSVATNTSTAANDATPANAAMGDAGTGDAAASATATAAEATASAQPAESPAAKQ